MEKILIKRSGIQETRDFTEEGMETALTRESSATIKDCVSWEEAFAYLEDHPAHYWISEEDAGILCVEGCFAESISEGTGAGGDIAIPCFEPKPWYAVLRGNDDYDHGNGTFDYTEAVRMLRGMLADYTDAHIAVLDTKDDFCIDTIWPGDCGILPDRSADDGER